MLKLKEGIVDHYCIISAFVGDGIRPLQMLRYSVSDKWALYPMGAGA